MANMKSYWLITFSLRLVGVWGIKLNDNGGYEDMYIVVQDTVPEDLSLLTRIQAIFTAASNKLFVATKNGVYFHKIKILLPKTWTSTPADYSTLPELTDPEGVIRVDNGDKTTPYVRSYGTCGKQGIFMNLHIDFLTGVTNWGPHENVIVHEWGHLRWGLGDEYGQPNQFYQNNNQWQAFRCSEAVQFTVDPQSCDLTNTAVMLNSNCQFWIDGSQIVSASLMGDAYIQQLTSFCDKEGPNVPIDQVHNKIPDNYHNLRCDRKSAWEVMRDHDDFQTDFGLPDSTDTTPEFEIFREGDKYQVLVLDVSGSMDGYRIANLRRSGQAIIQQYLKINSWLGIVEFSTSAIAKIDLTQISSNEDRSTLIAALPDYVIASTCIGCGIENAISMLTDKLGDPAHGVLIVITDGNNNVGDLDQSIQNAIDAKVVVHTVSISQSADTRMHDLSTTTGGVHIFYSDNNDLSILSDALAKAVSGGATSVNSGSVTIMSEAASALSLLSNVVSFEFTIDGDLGVSTVVSVLTASQVNVNITIYCPDGSTIVEQQSDIDYIYSEIPGTAKGTYQVQVETSAYTTSLEYFVLSYPKDNNAIRMFPRLESSEVDLSLNVLPKIIAEVTKRDLPVVNVSVEALVVADKNCTVQLKDNGIDPDDERNDGLYSGYIPYDCLSNGRVSIKVQAIGEAGATQLLSDSSSGAPSAVFEEEIFETFADSFQRVALAEDLQITNYIYSNVDITPPNRITDVQIDDIRTETNNLNENRNFTITWTAPGDDMNIGNATRYEIRYTDDIDVLVNDFSTAKELDLQGINIQPAAAGETEHLVLSIEANEVYNTTMFFAIVAVDEEENYGQASNINPIVVANGYQVKAAEYVYVPISVTVVDDPDNIATEESNTSRVVIIATVVTVLAAGIFATGVIVFLCKHKSKGKIEDSEMGSQVRPGSGRTSQTNITMIAQHPPTPGREIPQVKMSQSAVILPASLSDEYKPMVPGAQSVNPDSLYPQASSDTDVAQTTETSSIKSQTTSEADVGQTIETGSMQSQSMAEIDFNQSAETDSIQSQSMTEADIEEPDEDIDTYIRERINNFPPFLKIPSFLKTNFARAEPNDELSDSEEEDQQPYQWNGATGTTATDTVSPMDDLQKRMQNLPPLPFQTHTNLEADHPPPSQAPRTDDYIP